MKTGWLVRSWESNCDGEDAIYRDVNGRRVVIDGEGFGLVRVEHSKVPLILADGAGERSIGEGLHRAEGSGFTVLALGPGRVDARWQTCSVPLSDWEPAPWTPRNGHCEARMLRRLSVGDLPSDVSVQNMSEVSELASCDEEGRALSAPVAAHLNRMEIPIDLDGVSGLTLVKSFDRFHGRQRARVLLGGTCVGVWYEPFQNRVCRWGLGWLGVRIPDDVKGPTVLAIDPPPGTPLWSVSSLELSVWCD